MKTKWDYTNLAKAYLKRPDYSGKAIERQAGERFDEVVREIENYLRGLGVKAVTVPYTTRIWAAAKA